MQKALIVKLNNGKFEHNELNTLLADYWVVKHTCAMPSTNITVSPICLVIIEKF